MLKTLPLLVLISCGVAENESTVQTGQVAAKGASPSDSTDESLGFNRMSAIVQSSASGLDGVDQYVRFTRGKNKCSGVLSWEWEAPNDIYLYTARHCFEISTPVGGVQWDFDVKSQTKPLIDSAHRYNMKMELAPFTIRSDNLEALSLNEQTIASGFGKNRSENSKPTDVVRLYQYTVKGHNSFRKICDSGSIVRAGYRGSFGYPDPKLNKPNGVVKTVSAVEFEALVAKLSKWLPGTKLNLSSQLVKLAETTTMPGESGSPVFVAAKTDFVEDLNPNRFRFECIDGIMTREITRLGRPSETYYNVMSFSGTSRSWSPIRGSRPTNHQKVNVATTPDAPIRVERTPNADEVALSLIDVTTGADIISEIVPLQSAYDKAYERDCDALVRKTYARKSSNEFECFANGSRVFFYEAPGYDVKFRK
jgi:hypothetical protein